MNPQFPRAIGANLAGCHMCGKVSPVAHGNCPRCGSPLHQRKPRSIERTISLMAAAAILYIPAMTLPVMTLQELALVEPTTIVEGMLQFWENGDYPIALVIFTASILIPLLKIVALAWLCAAATGRVEPSPRMLARVYWLTELLGRWSMIDIFVVGILVALVQLGTYMSVVPGPGALAFGLVVVLTMFAATSFDPRLLWDRIDPFLHPPTPPDTRDA